MTRRTLLVGLAAFALAAWAAGPVTAEDKAGTGTEGMVVKAGDGKLTMTNKDGEGRAHARGRHGRADQLRRQGVQWRSSRRAPW